MQPHNYDLEKYFNEAAAGSLSSTKTLSGSSNQFQSTTAQSSSTIVSSTPHSIISNSTISTLLLTHSTSAIKQLDSTSKENLFTRTYPSAYKNNNELINNSENDYKNDQDYLSEKNHNILLNHFGQNNLNTYLYNNNIENNDISKISNENSNLNTRVSYVDNQYTQYSLGKSESNINDCSDNRESKSPDTIYCNIYHSCSNGVYQTMLCLEGYLFSSLTQKCEKRNQVNCGKRIALEFDRTNVPYLDYMNDYYNQAAMPKIVNGSLECSLGADGYFADPEFCNIYHHCLAGVDYAEQCPHQLVWNDRKKMCDWQTSVNCTGRIIPVAQGFFKYIQFIFQLIQY